MEAIEGVLQTFVQKTERDGVLELGSYLTAKARREHIAATVLACQQNISPAEAIRRADELIELLDADTSSLIPHPSSLPSSTTPAAGPSQGTPGGQALTNPPTGAPTCVDATPRADSAGVEPSPAPSAEAGACHHPNAAPAGAHSPTAWAATWDNDPDGDHANEDQKRPAPAMTEAQVLAFHEMAGLLNDLRFQPELTNALWARIDLAHKHALAAMPIGMGVRS